MRCIASTSPSMLTRPTTGLIFSHSQSHGSELADEIDYSNRLIAFIDDLAGSKPPIANTQPEEIESGVRSLKRLTAAIVTISSSLMAGRLAAGS